MGIVIPAGSPAISARDADSGLAGRAAPGRRVGSIDIIRGAVMVLMAIDHVRVFAGVPAGGATPGVFFTRWVTHFCAPAFVFLAGTSAFLHGRRLGSQHPRALARFLAIRGAWLVLLELTVFRLAWTFNFDYAHYLLAGVIWVIGWSMILLAGLLWLPTVVIGIVGLVLIGGHNLLDGLASQSQGATSGSFTWLWQLLYFGGPIALGDPGPQFFVLYSIVPWIGVIAAGYAFGAVLQLDEERRRRMCLAIGLGAIAVFLVLRGFNLYGNPTPWGGAQSRLPAALSFLNTNKYPASLQFLLMTLGPTIALMPVLDHARGRVAGWLTTFGRVPFFYYLLHIPLIHSIALLVSLVRQGEVIPWLFANHPVMVPPAPEGYRWSLPLLYAVTIVAVGLLYFPCKWFADLKARRRDAWLSFL